MKTYAAIGEKSGHIGALYECLAWALDKVEKGHEPLYQIVRCRAGETEGKVFAQVHEDGVEHLEHPVYVQISRLIEDV